MSGLTTMRLRLLAALPLPLLLAACAGQSEPPSGTTTQAPSATEDRTAAPTSPAPVETDAPAPAGLTEATVTRVVDGDTIVVETGGVEHRLRYIGIDTPETVHPSRPVECFGREASARNSELVEGKTVWLEKDVSETDDFGRLLRYVWLDPFGERMVNALLVEEGYAQASTYPPDVKYAELFVSLQTEAREAGRGLWGDNCNTPAPSLVAGACEYSGTSEPVIKGNISQRTGERIYHVPGGEFYEQTVIDEAAGERWFCTETEALEAGWRRSMR